MTNIARFQTDLREEHLDPSETKRGKGTLGTVSTEHHKMRRSGSSVYIPQRFRGSADAVFNLSSGVLTSSVLNNPDSEILRDTFGSQYISSFDVHVDALEVRAMPLFELERLMTRPLTELDLIDVKDDSNDRSVSADYISAARAHITAFLAKYREEVAASRLGKPKIEAYFLAEQSRHHARPEDLQRVFGGQLYRTLQAAYAPRSGKKR